ncbi:MAG: polysaccharide biosynthesis tyrosine autokinase [Acidobacteria bacterium]|nr:polysaccharide biosynthesis tyrosine autokinase [Acidobacteriota bacterium]
MKNQQLPVIPDHDPQRSLPALLQSGQLQLSAPLEEEGVHLVDYWRIILKRKWVILLCFLIATVTVFIANMKMTPIYKATATIKIAPEQSNILPYKDVVADSAGWAARDEYVQTQHRILRSKSLADRVINAMHLDEDTRFIGRDERSFLDDLKATVAGWFSPGGNEAAESAADKPYPVTQSQYSPWVGAFLGGLEVEPVRDTQLVQVSFNSPDPHLAYEVINTFANEFIQHNFETRYQATNQATDFLQKQITQLQARLEKSEENLIYYARDKNIMVLDQQQDVVFQKLAELNAALTAAQSERIKKESLYKIATSIKDPLSNFPNMLRNNVIEELERELAQRKQEYAKMSSTFTDEWPEMRAMVRQMEETEKQLRREKEEAIANTITEYETARQQERLLQEAFEIQSELSNAVKEHLIQYNILKREVDTNKNIYEGMLQRLKEASVATGLKSSNIEIVDRAEVPGAPAKPKKTMNLLMGMIVGLLVGVGMAFFLEYIDNTIKTPEEVETLTSLPALGLIPSQLPSDMREARVANKTSLMLTQQSREERRQLDLTVHLDPSSSIAEAYRSLRTSILLSNPDAPPRTFLFTSPRPQEGKTTASLNTAIALANIGKRVALIDLDLRKPRVHKVFEIDSQQGMSTFLAGTSDLAPLIQQTEIDNLYVIPAGPIPPNPAELLSSMRMHQSLELLKEYFDHIVIDTPPLLTVADARILSNLMDGVILVVRSGDTPRQILQQAQKSLQLIKAKILGILINDADLSSADYYYYSKYYYYYSEEEGRKKMKKRKRRKATPKSA